MRRSGWGPLFGRWQSEVARYEREHHARPAAEITPSLPPNASLIADRLLAPTEDAGTS